MLTLKSCWYLYFLPFPIMHFLHVYPQGQEKNMSLDNLWNLIIIWFSCVKVEKSFFSPWFNYIMSFYRPECSQTFSYFTTSKLPHMESVSAIATTSSQQTDEYHPLKFNDIIPFASQSRPEMETNEIIDHQIMDEKQGRNCTFLWVKISYGALSFSRTSFSCNW